MLQHQGMCLGETLILEHGSFKAFVDTMYNRASMDHLIDNLIEVNQIVAEE